MGIGDIFWVKAQAQKSRFCWDYSARRWVSFSPSLYPRTSDIFFGTGECIKAKTQKSQDIKEEYRSRFSDVPQHSVCSSSNKCSFSLPRVGRGPGTSIGGGGDDPSLYRHDFSTTMIASSHDASPTSFLKSSSTSKPTCLTVRLTINLAMPMLSIGYRIFEKLPGWVRLYQ